MVRGTVVATTPTTSFTSDVADAISDRQRLRLGYSGPRQATAGQISFPVSLRRERKRKRDMGCGGSLPAVATEAALGETTDGVDDVTWVVVAATSHRSCDLLPPSLFEGRRFGKIPGNGSLVASHHPFALGCRTQATSPEGW
ncbi:hypothetical protein CDL15_Pgr002258 [Punica granatum]|uniref:Uncharacterized protein n=1 Tax=Punica granatum TaxID=22663 RepID=A0A218XCM0_PUNGR|nr:hypothetical protein CDL15_Pgr002258 [Punica granatum]PKH69504.1 hypothetical protein CRG98_050129 [Punica granatum]